MCWYKVATKKLMHRCILEWCEVQGGFQSVHTIEHWPAGVISEHVNSNVGIDKSIQQDEGYQDGKGYYYWAERNTRFLHIGGTAG